EADRADIGDVVRDRGKISLRAAEAGEGGVEGHILLLAVLVQARRMASLGASSPRPVTRRLSPPLEGDWMPPIAVQVAVAGLLLRPSLVAVTTRRSGPSATLSPASFLPSQAKDMSPACCAPSVSLWTTAPL